MPTTIQTYFISIMEAFSIRNKRACIVWIVRFKTFVHTYLWCKISSISHLIVLKTWKLEDHGQIGIAAIACLILSLSVFVQQNHKRKNLFVQIKNKQAVQVESRSKIKAISFSLSFCLCSKTTKGRKKKTRVQSKGKECIPWKNQLTKPFHVIEQPEGNYWSSGVWCYFKNTKAEFSEHNIINNQIS